MDTDPATPQALAEFRAAREALFRAFDHDLRQGRSANEIARMAQGTVSRPVVLAYLTAKRVAADVRRMLRSAGLDGLFGAEITGETGRGAREVCVMLVVDPREVVDDRDSVVARLVDLLRANNLRLDAPWRGSLAEALWDGEPVRLHRP
ncbi:hypothetical protein [Actinokineospora bangkokensis]|uniref:Uncharacterized protein n=1 Tax=Actinokineospora bangkokensis TaxID=1193682 RepID=A0A1Q9LKQ3_9PSEU|nr:hypothetical protein [Actinokineospora bangkokensis]OLR92600.1 hypothetical protein BJP25_21360 [Actinokineospora bangkokensis]